MGRKKGRVKGSFAEEHDKLNYFEYRLNPTTNIYYLFNPWTGECVLDLTVQLDRSKSYWKQPDKHPTQYNATSTTLYPLHYCCKAYNHTRKPTDRFDNDTNAAATVMTSLIRGFLARVSVRHIYNTRYFKEIDNKTGFYCFYDRKYTHTGIDNARHMDKPQQQQYYKPVLARIDDIEDKPDSSRVDVDYYGYSRGPIMKKAHIGKSKGSNEKIVLAIKKPPAAAPIPEPEMIDFDSVSYQMLTLWLDTQAVNILYLSDIFTYIKTSHWDKLLQSIKVNIDDACIRCLAIYGMSKMTVSVSGDGITTTTSQPECDCIEYLLSVLDSCHSTYFGCNLSFLSMNALYSMMTYRECRKELFNTSHISVDFEQTLYIEARLDIFIRYLIKIPVEYEKVRSKKYSAEYEYVGIPTSKGKDFTEIVLKFISILAHDPSYRDILAERAAGMVAKAIKVCIEEQPVVVSGFRCLYNFCFMCEVGQLCCIETDMCHELIGLTRVSELASDYETQYEARRLELSLEPDGWRGKVEEVMTFEMQKLQLSKELY